MPEVVVNPNQVPDVAHKESLIEPESADDIQKYIEAAKFSTLTKNKLLLRLSLASGKEFRTANLSAWQGLEYLAEFKMRLISELEIEVPRSERERKEYTSTVGAIEELYAYNLSQSIRDEYGRNVFWAQYVQETRTSSYSEVNAREQVTNLPGGQAGGLNLNRMPLIGGFFK